MDVWLLSRVRVVVVHVGCTCRACNLPYEAPSYVDGGVMNRCNAFLGEAI